MSANPGRRARRILFGLGYGALAGWIAREALGGTALLEHGIAWVAYPIGQVFLRMLFIAVLPLVVSSLAQRRRDRDRRQRRNGRQRSLLDLW